MSRRDVRSEENEEAVVEARAVVAPVRANQPEVIDAMLGNISFGGTIGTIGAGGTGGGVSTNVRTAPDGQRLPTVEIYPTQPDIIFFQGQPFTYVLKGACYDLGFSGRVVIEPISPGSCNVLLNSRYEMFLQFPPNAQIQIAITLFSTQRTGLTFVPCGIRYSAFHQYIDSLKGKPAEQNVSKGSQVSFKYRVKRAPRFPGDIEP
jgi:hypothetical protein